MHLNRAILAPAIGPLGGDWGRIMPTFSPELIQTMRAALEEAMTKVPLNKQPLE
jgi:hypothetical protein